MSELPGYYHLSQTQVERLSFHVTIRCVRTGRTSASADENGTNASKNSESVISTDIAWQEKLSKPPKASPENQVCVFTLTSADADSYEEKYSNSGKYGAVQGNATYRGFSLRKYIQYQSSNNDQCHRIAEFNDRLHRENPCQMMVIMAAVGSHEVILCAMKLFPQSRCISSCPRWSSAEPEDWDSCQVFMSQRGVDEVINKGPRLTTYTFSTPAGSVFEYTIEWKRDGGGFCDDTDLIVAEQHHLDKEVNEDRRERIREEFEAFDCMHEKGTTKWDIQANIEIVSAIDFCSSNLLLSAPNGSNIAICYRILKLGACSEKNEVILKGTTSSIQSYSAIRGSLEFITQFVVAFIGVAFVALLCLDSASVLLRTIMLSIVSLVLIIKAGVIGDAERYHINHQFSLLYNDQDNEQISNSVGPRPKLLLELRAYFRHNFDVTSLAGCATVPLPAEPGSHNVWVPTWKPIACPGMSKLRGKLYDFFLGSCLSEISPLDSVPTSENESQMANEAGIAVYSRGGLIVDSSGSINVRVTVMQNFFGDDKCHSDMHTAEESHQQRVKMRETVDEVLSRVRKNKRGRMARVYNSSDSSVKWRQDGAALHSEDMKENDVCNKVSTRTAEVLDRVRSRKHLANRGNPHH